jgi:hypothetical protein
MADGTPSFATAADAEENAFCHFSRGLMVSELREMVRTCIYIAVLF